MGGSRSGCYSYPVSSERRGIVNLRPKPIVAYGSALLASGRTPGSGTSTLGSIREASGIWPPSPDRENGRSTPVLITNVRGSAR